MTKVLRRRALLNSYFTFPDDRRSTCLVTAQSPPEIEKERKEKKRIERRQKKDNIINKPLATLGSRIKELPDFVTGTGKPCQAN